MIFHSLLYAVFGITTRFICPTALGHYFFSWLFEWLSHGNVSVGTHLFNRYSSSAVCSHANKKCYHTRYTRDFLQFHWGICYFRQFHRVCSGSGNPIAGKCNNRPTIDWEDEFQSRVELEPSTLFESNIDMPVLRSFQNDGDNLVDISLLRISTTVDIPKKWKNADVRPRGQFEKGNI
jgi:hypothetical protein